MNVRFFTALAIALTIFAINAGATWAREPASVMEVKYVAASRSSDRMVQLPEVVVRPSQAQLESIAAEREGGVAAGAAVEGAKKVVAAKVRERIARVSVLVPYYTFGGRHLRATD